MLLDHAMPSEGYKSVDGGMAVHEDETFACQGLA